MVTIEQKNEQLPVKAQNAYRESTGEQKLGMERSEMTGSVRRVDPVISLRFIPGFYFAARRQLAEAKKRLKCQVKHFIGENGRSHCPGS